MIITEILARNARMYGDKIALIEREPAKNKKVVMTWKEFDDMANRIANANRIYAGQRLVIPVAASLPPTSGQSYIVQLGDTLTDFHGKGLGATVPGRYEELALIIRIDQTEDHRNDKNKHSRNKGKQDDGVEFAENEFFFAKAVNEVLLERFIAVLIGHHRYDNEQEKEFEESGNKGVEVPYVGKIENSFEKVAFLLVRFLWPSKENERKPRTKT